MVDVPVKHPDATKKYQDGDYYVGLKKAFDAGVFYLGLIMFLINH